MNQTKAGDAIYPSQAECARALGKSRNTIGRHLEKYGHLDFAMAGHVGRNCEWGGVTYPSISAAARAIGRNVQTIHKWISKGRTE
jgi:hypothetical protein